MVSPGPAIAAGAFDPATAGTPEEVWRAWDRWARFPALDPSADPPAGVLLVAAHPDDETLGAGGLLMVAADLGLPLTVVVATDGAASHPGSTTTPPEVLAERRRDEVTTAVRSLAPRADLRMLGLPDGDLASHTTVLGAGLDEVLQGADVAEGADATERADVAEGRPGWWVVAPWRGDQHPDHQAAGQAAAEVAGRYGALLLEYPVWAWHWARPEDGRLPWEAAVVVPLDPVHQDRKRAAVAAHRTQVHPLSPAREDRAVLPPWVLAHFDRPFEIYLRTPASATAVGSLPPAFFERFYAASGVDPWGFEDRWYERRKRALTLAALPSPHYRNGFEVGCSEGVLTTELAARVDHLLAVDVVADVVRRAKARVAAHQHVEVRQAQVPRWWPDGPFDLVVLSEVAYYLDEPELMALRDNAARSLTADGALVLCHWRHQVLEYPTTGDRAHDVLRSHPRLAVLSALVEEDLLLEVLVPAPAVSPARREGLR
ncbi:MAG: PIG-L family deacetylase [Angustibacter sp.]